MMFGFKEMGFKNPSLWQRLNSFKSAHIRYRDQGLILTISTQDLDIIILKVVEGLDYFLSNISYVARM